MSEIEILAKQSVKADAKCSDARTFFCQLKHQLQLPLVVLGAVLLSACSQFGGDNQPSPAGSSTQLPFDQPLAVSPVDQSIATDIVAITEQLLTPHNTTLQFPLNHEEPLLEYFITEFASAGYGIQRVSADQGPNFFTCSLTEDVEDNGEPLLRVSATIGEVQIARDYTVPRADMISPASPVSLSGTRAAIEVVDEPSGRFVVTNTEFSTANYVASLNLNDQAPPVISLITDDVVSGVASQSTAGASSQAVNSGRLEINNLFYADQSNFSSILDDYEQVKRQIIVFGNDSLVLGDTNKQLIEQFVQQQLDGDALISLVGCSNGPTELEIGNEGLALGRAERVTEALLSQGVARERILDEGCWAPVSAGDKFPGRGVVMELWRRNT